jgi:hypothetical protein
LQVALRPAVGAGIKCPACKSTHCRPSRWHSKHEKLGAQKFRPYRCEDCTNRFLAARNATRERILINGAAALLFCLGALIAGDIWFQSQDAPKIKRVEAASTVHSEENATGAAARREKGEAAGDAVKDPESPAEKLQKAADDGDVSAMLRLGRDLASGNTIPKDADQAARWIQLAAATGNAEGMFELGRFYRDGVGLVQDSVRAYVWFSRAAAANHLTAMQARDQLVLTMNEEKLQEARKSVLTAEPIADTVRRKK